MTLIIRPFSTITIALFLFTQVGVAQETLTVTTFEDAMIYNNTRPGYEYTRDANYWNYPRITTLAWTSGGYPSYFRSLLKFDLSSIPPGSTIESASLYLYSDPSATSDANVNYGSNAFYFEKVLQNWAESSVTWNTQPATTSTNRIWTGPSTSTAENIIVNLLPMAQEWVNSPSTNFGMKMILENEIHYRARNYASTNHTDISIKPRLVISYRLPPPPPSPDGFAAQVTSASSITLTWIDNSAYESSFEIERSLTSGTGYNVIHTTEANTTSYSETGLAEGKTYYYRIRAVNSVGVSPFTTPVSATTPYIPAAPSMLTAEASSSSSLTLNWNDNSNNETGFQIERALSSGSGYGLIHTAPANTQTYTDPGLLPQTSYYYRVRAVTETDNSVFTSEISATTLSDYDASAVTTALGLYGFEYRYDTRNRQIKKRIPGGDWIFSVYDNRDRIVMTQDGNQRTKKQWTFTKYDALNRPIMTGLYTHDVALSQEAMTSLLSTTNLFETRDNNSPHGYTNTVFSSGNFITTNFDVLTVTYYDDYTFRPLLNDVRYNYHSTEYADQYRDKNGNSFQNVTGQITGTKTRVLGQPTYLWSVNYFDDRLRNIQNISTNVLTGVDRVTTVFDFKDRIIKTKTVHNVGLTSEHSVARTHEYDHGGRLLKIWHAVDSQSPVLLTMNQYNELGQLIAKQLHNTDPASTDDAQRTFKQKVDYRYNIRGWMTSINDINTSGPEDLLMVSLNYDLPSANGGIAQYNGNISEMVWKNADSDTKSYAFTYDPMQRIKEANYYNHAMPSENGRFNEKVLGPGGVSGYDLNGNIRFLLRTGETGEDESGFMTYGNTDDLTYHYAGNKLLKVDDTQAGAFGFVNGANTGDDYTYDGSGNMITDQNKDINGAATKGVISQITYNHLNLPENVRKKTSEYLRFTYDATGRKLRAEVFDTKNKLTSKTDYLGEFIYEDDALKFINTEEGRVIIDGASLEYQYFLKDHLGNVRTTFTAKEDVEQSLATLETVNASSEQSQFLYYDEAILVNHELFDHTYDGTIGGTYYSTRLTGGNTNAIYGLAKSLSVMPGDIIEMEVYAKYLDPNSSNWTPALTSFMTAVAGGTAPTGTVVDGGSAGSIGSGTFPYSGVFDHSNETGAAPKAYLNFIVFDREFNPIIGESGFIRITTNAMENGNNVAHDRLQRTGPLVIKEPGYVYIYLSNENETPVEVYFDDFRVEHVKSPVVQMDDYYPFGLTFNSYQRENSVEQRWKFQGQEHIDVIGLHWDSFKWRNHQPDIGRFFNIDPLAEKYYFNSPYAFSENKVVAHRELEGLESVDAGKAAEQQLKEEIKNVENIIMPIVNKILDAFTLPKQEGKTKIEKLNNAPIAVEEDQKDAGVKKTDTPSDLDGNLNPVYNPDGTAKGNKGGDEVRTQDGGQTKIENPDKPGGKIKVDSIHRGGYKILNTSDTSTIVGSFVEVDGKIIEIHRYKYNNITKKRKPLN